jgi:hypothetical protein
VVNRLRLDLLGMTLTGMSPDRARLLAALRKRATGSSPLTATQQGIWLAEQLDPGTSGYHDTAMLLIDGQLDTNALRGALSGAQANHEALRARICDCDGEPRQVFDINRVDWNIVDLASVPAPARQSQLDRLVTAVATRPFDLSVGPLWRARLVRLTDREHVLVFVMHHLITDGWSHGIMLESLLAGYAYRVGDGPAPVPRPGYAAWLAERRRREHAATVSNAAEALTANLPALPYRLRLPGLSPGRTDRKAAELPVPLPATSWMTFEKACHGVGTTRFMAVVGLFGLALSRATGGDGVLFSMPLAGRYDAAHADLLGCLISVAPVDVRIAAADTPMAAVSAGKEAVGRALCLADLPYRDVVRAAGPLPHGDDPLTNVGVEQFNAPVGEVSIGRLRIVPLRRTQVRLRHDLTLSVPSAGGAAPTLLYPSSRWSADRVALLASDMAALIQAATVALAT